MSPELPTGPINNLKPGHPPRSHDEPPALYGIWIASYLLWEKMIEALDHIVAGLPNLTGLSVPGSYPLYARSPAVPASSIPYTTPGQSSYVFYTRRVSDQCPMWVHLAANLVEIT